VTAPTPDSDPRSLSRQLARVAVIAALVSCSLNCVFNQLTARGAESLRGYGDLVSGGSLVAVLVGIGLGTAGLVGGLRNRSLDTAVIAVIGLVLNLGIVFVVVWYFALHRPELLQGR
jgi:predicted MFS family arabinose efflux permease